MFTRQRLPSSLLLCLFACLGPAARAADWEDHDAGGFHPIEEVTAPGLRRAARAVLKFSGATGFIISPDGYFLTNHHVGCDTAACALRQSVLIEWDRAGYRERLEGTLVLVDESLDLALYKAEARDLPYLQLSDAPAPPAPGTPVAIVGHPDGRPLEASFGRVLATDLASYGRSSIEYDAAAWWGSSGSPVFDRGGDVVALHWGWDGNGHHHGRLLGIPMSEVLARIPLIAQIARRTRAAADAALAPEDGVSLLLTGEQRGQLRPGRAAIWKLKVEPGRPRSVFLVGPPGADFDLYLRRGDRPDGATYDQASQQPGSLELLRVTEPGVHYLEVQAYAGSGAYRLRLN